ncbi:MAG: WD40/YVTN/BNR-like repeat-containing protein [Bdellovibrionales bacterium]
MRPPLPKKIRENIFKFLIATGVTALFVTFQNCGGKINFSVAASQNSQGTPAPTAPITSANSANDCTFNGHTIPDGNMVRAYLTANVPETTQCSYEFRLCTKGVLEGKFTNSTCAIIPGGCTSDGKNLTGTSIICSLASLAPLDRRDSYLWTKVLAPPAPILYVNSSNANGSRIFTSSAGTDPAGSGYGSSIFVSTDQGQTWKQTFDSPQTVVLRAIVSSSDGLRVAATGTSSDPTIGYGAPLYTSTDGGINWTVRNGAGLQRWQQMVSSADGMRLVVAGYNTGIYVSTDGGVSWKQSSAPTLNWQDFAASADAMKIFASAGGPLYFSNDGGVTWTPRKDLGDFIGGHFYGMQMSADGSHVAISSSYLYTSADGGASFTVHSGTPNYQDMSTSMSGYQEWNLMTMSTDGMSLAATGRGQDFIYTSADGGKTWAEEQAAGRRYWQDLKLSADGSFLFAVGGGASEALTYIGRRSSSAPKPLVDLSNSQTKPCMLHGIQVPNASYVVSYQSPEVAAGAQCEPVFVSCGNGTIAPYGPAMSCSVQ